MEINMSEVIIMSKSDLNQLIKDIAIKAGRASAKEVLAQIETKQDDKITQDEALKILNIGKDKLAKLREFREITFYTTTRPYMYSRSSIEKYLNQGKVFTPPEFVKNCA